jgi:hypothetical protein
MAEVAVSVEVRGDPDVFNRPVAGVAGDSRRSFAFEAQSTMREARLDEGKTARSQHRKAS